MFVLAQSDGLDKIKSLKPVISTKSDAIRLLGEGLIKGNSTWYRLPDMSIEIVYSNGTCRDGWLAPRDNVTQISAHFFDHRKLSVLKAQVNLNKLRTEGAFDVLGEKYYHDDDKGIGYGVNEIEKVWFMVWYYPSKQHPDARCIETPKPCFD